MLKFSSSTAGSGSALALANPSYATSSSGLTTSLGLSGNNSTDNNLQQPQQPENANATVAVVHTLLRYASFSQDGRSLSVCTTEEYNLYNCWPWSILHQTNNDYHSIVEMMFSTSSLIALCGIPGNVDLSDVQMKLINFKRGSELAIETYLTPVHCIRFNRKRLVVFLETEFHVYDMSTMKRITIVTTSPNPKGVVALSPANESFIAYPEEGGHLKLYDAMNCTDIIKLHAHRSAAECLVFNQDGTLLASVSSTATVIRVYEVPSGREKYLFRRGTYSTKVSCLAFSHDSTLLAAVSITGSIHIFRLQPTGSYAWNFITYYLPQPIHDIVEPVRNTWLIKLPIQGIPGICSFSTGETNEEKLKTILIFCADGTLYEYQIPKTDTEECTLIQTKSLLSTTAASSPSQSAT